MQRIDTEDDLLQRASGNDARQDRIGTAPVPGQDVQPTPGAAADLRTQGLIGDNVSGVPAFRQRPVASIRRMWSAE